MADARISQQVVEYALPLTTTTRVSQFVIETAISNIAVVRISQFIIEYIKGPFSPPPNPPPTPGCPTVDNPGGASTDVCPDPGISGVL